MSRKEPERQVRMGATTDRLARSAMPLPKYDVIVSYAHDDDLGGISKS